MASAPQEFHLGPCLWVRRAMLCDGMFVGSDPYPAHACGCAAQCCVGVQRGSIVSVCAAAYELPTLGVDGSRSLKGYEVMAHPPTRNIQNVSVALYCAGGLPSGFLFQGTASGPQQREETGKGLSCFSLRGPVRHGIVTMEEMSLISRRRFMYSSTHT